MTDKIIIVFLVAFSLAYLAYTIRKNAKNGNCGCGCGAGSCGKKHHSADGAGNDSHDVAKAGKSTGKFSMTNSTCSSCDKREIDK